MSYYGGFAPYVSVAEKRAKADRQLEKLRKKGKNPEPVILEGRSLASTWWGQAWISNLESYGDYSNRIGRGRSYVRNHAVLDLKICKGNVTALVQGSGSKPYEVLVTIAPLDKSHWKELTRLCNNQIASMDQLAAGIFPRELSNLFTQHESGLFPSPEEIRFSCSCPDFAYMCKHVAAVLYGVGARLDCSPLLLFELRGVDGQELIRRSVESRLEAMLKNAGKESGRVIREENVHDIFGI